MDDIIKKLNDVNEIEEQFSKLLISVMNTLTDTDIYKHETNLDADSRKKIIDFLEIMEIDTDNHIKRNNHAIEVLEWI